MINGQTITLSDGSKKNIENLKKGDLVLSYNTNTETHEFKKVTNKKKSFTERLIRVKLEDNTEILATEDQLFYILDDGLKMPSTLPSVSSQKVLDKNIKALLLTHKLVDSKFNHRLIESIETVFEPEIIEVFNLEVEETNNYYVNDILVYN